MLCGSAWRKRFGLSRSVLRLHGRVPPEKCSVFFLEAANPIFNTKFVRAKISEHVEGAPQRTGIKVTRQRKKEQNMLGYKSEMTSKQRWNHHLQLKKRTGTKIQAELDFAYHWMSHPSFLTGMETKRSDMLEFCKRSMENAPVDLLDHMIKQNKTNDVKFHCKMDVPCVAAFPKCCCCTKKLADSIVEITSFSCVKCDCGQQISHIECADKQIGKTPQCSVCKKYFILNNIKDSTLQQTLLKF